MPWLVGIAIACWTCTGFAESTHTRDPAAWLVAGFSVAGLLTLLCAYRTLRGGGWAGAAGLALAAAGIVALGVFSASAPSTSRSCANNGQPKSAGTFDCDTSYGLGGLILLAAFWVPAFGLAAAGSGAGRLAQRWAHSE